MIGLTRLNGCPIVVNAELIETIEATPDTVVSLTNGKKLVVLETPDQVVELAVRYRREIAAAPGPATAGAPRAIPLTASHED